MLKTLNVLEKSLTVFLTCNLLDAEVENVHMRVNFAKQAFKGNRRRVVLGTRRRNINDNDYNNRDRILRPRYSNQGNNMRK